MLRTTTLFAATLCTLLLWRYTYPYTCFSLAAPIFFATVICAGRFVENMHRRRYWASYYLNTSSSLYPLITGKTFSLSRALITGIVYTFSLSAFTALSGIIEFILLIFNGLIALFLLPVTTNYVRKHAAVDVTSHATRRLLTITCFTITAIIYIVILLNTKIPDYIDPTSLKVSVDAASQQVASQCAYINITLKLVQEFTATQWYFMVANTGFLESMWLRYASWLVFLGFSSLALMGMSVLSAELAVYSSRRPMIPRD